MTLSGQLTASIFELETKLAFSWPAVLIELDD